MFVTDQGLEYLAGSHVGGLAPGAEVEPARVDTVAIGDGETPMPSDMESPGSNQLTNQLYSATAPSNEIIIRRGENDPTIVEMLVNMVHGLRLPLGTPITEVALIVSDPQVTTGPDGELLDQIVVQYDHGSAVPLGIENPDQADGTGQSASATKLGLPLNADRV